MFTFNDQGEIENEGVWFQLKATDHPNYRENEKLLSFYVEVADIENWRRQIFPVILVVYDAVRKIAYWLHIQEYMESVRPNLRQKTLTIHLNTEQILNRDAIQEFRRRKNVILEANWKRQSS